VPTDPRTLALLLARGRVVFGLVALAVPGLLARLVLGANSPPARALLRMVGVRDVALGVGAITNLRTAEQDAEWVSMGAISDAGDALAFVVAPIGFRRVANGLFSASAAALGLAVSRQLADERARAVVSAED
jgi:hypothetical protein